MGGDEERYKRRRNKNPPGPGVLKGSNGSIVQRVLDGEEEAAERRRARRKSKKAVTLPKFAFMSKEEEPE